MYVQVAYQSLEMQEIVVHEFTLDEEIEHSPADLARWTELAKDCIKMKQHMTIFFTDDDGSFADLDQSVLKALIKGKKWSSKLQS
ncbi:unnamed protein product [Clavelina lepadiformis]|uniref:Uncharacterized protein n=1 Tax=Clavelina lepadiformis TaxID=159417 RepID=A0ABP0G4S1_CLALP